MMLLRRVGSSSLKGARIMDSITLNGCFVDSYYILAVTATADQSKTIFLGHGEDEHSHDLTSGVPFLFVTREKERCVIAIGILNGGLNQTRAVYFTTRGGEITEVMNEDEITFAVTMKRE